MDEIIRAVSKDGFVKISVVTARDAVQRANAIHHCSPTAIAALGRSLCAASMLGDLLKEENGTLTLRISGGGGLGTIIAVSDSDGNVRGMVSNPAFDLPTRPDGKLDVGGAVGRDGMLTVSRDIGLREPYVGSTELVSGEIAEDLSAYLGRERADPRGLRPRRARRYRPQRQGSRRLSRAAHARRAGGADRQSSRTTFL